MKVLKFGGTSVKTSENIKKVISIVVDISSGTEVVVVVSALGGITDLLHLAAKQASIADPVYIQTLKEIQKRHNDVLNKLLTKTNKKVLNNCWLRGERCSTRHKSELIIGQRSEKRHLEFQTLLVLRLTMC